MSPTIAIVCALSSVAGAPAVLAAGPYRVVRPIADLPATLRTEPQELGLYVGPPGPYGYDTVYLVNRTDRPVELNAQDNDPYLKLEHEASPGIWVRAQSHQYSWCGNSYMDPPTLQPGEFIALKPYRLTSGRPARVRYSLYSQTFELSSTPFMGFVDDAEIARAALDRMAIASAALEVVSDIALGTRHVDNEDHLDPRYVAIIRLGELAKTDSAARQVLKKITARGSGSGPPGGVDYASEASRILARSDRERGCYKRVLELHATEKSRQAAGAGPDLQALRKAYDNFLETLDKSSVKRDYPRAIEDLSSGFRDEQRRGIRVLGATQDPYVLPWLVPLLDSEELRNEAALSIERLVSTVLLDRRDRSEEGRVVICAPEPGEVDLAPISWVALKMMRTPGLEGYGATMAGYLGRRDFETDLRLLMTSRHPAVANAARYALRVLELEDPEGEADIER